MKMFKDNLDPLVLDNQDPVVALLGRMLKGDGEEPTVEGLQQKLTEAQTKVSSLESAAADWRKGIDPNPDSNPTLQKFKTTKDLFDSYVHLQSTLGKDKVIVPKGVDDKEGWQALAKALGVPESPDKYEFPEVKRPDGMEKNENQLKAFRDIAHKLNLTPHQVQELYKWQVQETAKVFTSSIEQIDNSRKTAETQLRGEWGAKYDSQVELAQKVINKYGDPNTKLDPAKLNDPGFIKMIARIGGQLSESNLIEGTGFGRMTPQEAKSEINKIMGDSKHPYYDNSHPGHKEAVEHMTQLYQMANPDLASDKQ